MEFTFDQDNLSLYWVTFPLKKITHIGKAVEEFHTC